MWRELELLLSFSCELACICSKAGYNRVMNDQLEIGGDLQDEYLEIQEREEALAGAPWNQPLDVRKVILNMDQRPLPTFKIRHQNH